MLRRRFVGQIGAWRQIGMVPMWSETAISRYGWLGHVIGRMGFGRRGVSVSGQSTAEIVDAVIIECGSDFSLFGKRPGRPSIRLKYVPGFPDFASLCRKAILLPTEAGKANPAPHPPGLSSRRLPSSSCFLSLVVSHG